MTCAVPNVGAANCPNRLSSGSAAHAGQVCKVLGIWCEFKAIRDSRPLLDVDGISDDRLSGRYFTRIISIYSLVSV